MSSGRPRILIGTNPDGSIVLQYKPLETGNHDLSANYNEINVEGRSACLLTLTLNFNFTARRRVKSFHPFVIINFSNSHDWSIVQ